MRGDGGFVPAGRRTGDDGLRRLAAELLQRAQRERKESGAGLRLGGPGRLAESAHRLGEESDLTARRQDGRGVVERARATLGHQRKHPQAGGQRGQIGARAQIRADDPGGRAAEVVDLSLGECAEGVDRAGAGALEPGRAERGQPERAGEMSDQLRSAHFEPAADASHRLVGDGEEDHVHVAQRRRLEPAPAPPRGEHTDSGGRKRLEEGARDGPASQHCRSLDHSRRNSTPSAPAEATRVSPLFTRPARISSASGDSTRRWITCRIGRAPSATW